MKSDKDQTNQRMEDPQPGDRFHEMYSYWMKVVSRHAGLVIYQEIRCDSEWGPPIADTPEDFKRRFAYKTIPGYWIQYRDREGFIGDVPKEWPEFMAWLIPILADRDKRIIRPAMDSAML